MRPCQALLGEKLLLKSEGVADVEVLQTLVGVVDAELLKMVGGQRLKAEDIQNACMYFSKLMYVHCGDKMQDN